MSIRTETIQPGERGSAVLNNHFEESGSKRLNSFRFDMWRCGRKILLSDLLESLVFPKELTWALLDFCGSGAPPNGGRMDAFEAKVRSLSTGFPMSSEQLDQFATGLTDITDIQLVGMLIGKPVLEIRGVDSTFWDVRIDESAVRPVGRIFDPPAS